MRFIHPQSMTFKLIRIFSLLYFYSFLPLLFLLQMRQKKICICGAFNLLFCNVAYFWCGFSRLVIYCVVFMLYIFLHIHLYTLNSIALCDHSYLHHGNEKIKGKKRKAFRGEREMENDSFESSD